MFLSLACLSHQQTRSKYKIDKFRLEKAIICLLEQEKELLDKCGFQKRHTRSKNTVFFPSGGPKTPFRLLSSFDIIISWVCLAVV